MKAHGMHRKRSTDRQHEILAEYGITISRTASSSEVFAEIEKAANKAFASRAGRKEGDA